MITISGNVQSDSLKLFVQKSAFSLSIEGTVQGEGDGLAIYACGVSDRLDQFIDLLYKGVEKSKLKDIIVEPFISEKDFRGVFRVIG